MEQTLEADQQTQTQTQDQGQDQSQGSNDPFSVDEGTLASLAPEARVAFDAAVKQWRTKADEHYRGVSQKAVDEATSKFKDYDEQKQYANALRQLTSDPRFVQWYQLMQGQQQQQQQPQQVGSPEEWAQAVQEAAAGQNQRLIALQQRQFQAWAAPTIREFNDLKEQQSQDRERDSLFTRHPDAEELDRTEGSKPSLLEMAVYQVVDKNRGTWEQAYEYARSIADGYKKQAKDAALGLVTDKKNGVTEKGPQQLKETDNIIEVGSGEEALRKNIEASMRGQKVTYVAKSRLARK